MRIAVGLEVDDADGADSSSSRSDRPHVGTDE